MRYFSLLSVLMMALTVGAGDFQEELQRELRHHPFKGAERGDRITVVVRGRIVYGRIKALDHSGVTLATLAHPGGVYYERHTLSDESRALLYKSDHEALWRERVKARQKPLRDWERRRSQNDREWERHKNRIQERWDQGEREFSDFKDSLKNKNGKKAVLLTRFDELKIVEILDSRHFIAIPIYKVSVPGTENSMRLPLPLSCFEGNSQNLYSGKKLTFRKTARINKEFYYLGRGEYQPAIGKAMEVNKYKIKGL